MGVEPTSPAWEAGVMAVIRRPHRFEVANSSTLPQRFVRADSALQGLRLKARGGKSVA